MTQNKKRNLSCLSSPAFKGGLLGGVAGRAAPRESEFFPRSLQLGAFLLLFSCLQPFLDPSLGNTTLLLCYSTEVPEEEATSCRSLTPWKAQSVSLACRLWGLEPEQALVELPDFPFCGKPSTPLGHQFPSL